MTAKEEKLQFIRQRIKQLREFLLTSNQVLSLNVDGMSASFDCAGAIKELQDLERQEMNLLHPNNWIRSVDLSQAFL